MTQLTQHPFKEVIKRAGATHFWEADLATNQVVDRIGSADLIRSPGEDSPGGVHMTAMPAGGDPHSGVWTGPWLDYLGENFVNPDNRRYLTMPAAASQQYGAFTLFAKVVVSRDYLRNILCLGAPGTPSLFRIDLDRDVTYAGSTWVSWRELVFVINGQQTRIPLTEPRDWVFDPPAPVSLYLAWSRSDTGLIRARVIIPGSGHFEQVDTQARHGAVFLPGFFRGVTVDLASSGHATFSNAFILPREASDDELYRWVKLLETGRQGDGRCFPLNNSEGALSGLLEPGDTLLDLAGGTDSFAAPGPTEESRVTLINPANPEQFEVCALLVNDGNQLEVRRGQEGTQARQWPAGTQVKGLLTEWLTRTPNHWVPSFASGDYFSDQPSYLALRDKPFIPSAPADIGAASQSDFLTSRTQAAEQRAALGDRITELERGPTWASIRGKPQVATQDDLNEMAQIMNAMMLRIIALESGGGGSDPDTSHYLTDASGAHLTDASGAILTGPVTIEGALLDQYGAQLTDASGNILMGPPIAGKTLTDSTGQTLTDGAMAPLLSA